MSEQYKSILAECIIVQEHESENLVSLNTKSNQGLTRWDDGMSLADVLLSRHMYFSIICWEIKLTKVGLDRIMVYTLYNNLSYQ